MAFLTVENISGYNEGRLIVDNVSFEQQPGENIAIAGETGSGKTSLLKMIAGLMQPSSGNIFLKNSRVAGPDEQLIAGHKKIAFLSQHFELRNNYRVEELLDMANKLAAKEADKIYEICDIGHLLKRWSDELSGGE
ncbi:MAG TPA: ABC transporter ATP-binding protein, partial [Ferruginibacter sp.]|nr:ABC transporter ATP-binding protein [Ferruginibacter sp.]